jgi:regulator of protease activity HflC (stomatin/prohibitin superfamily)
MLCFIKTGTTGIVETLGKFSKLAAPGAHFYIPLLQTIKPLSNRVFTKECKMQVRTKDKVFPTIDLAVQYQVLPKDTYNAFYSRQDPLGDMASFIDNTVRARASTLTLDELYESQSHVAQAIMEEVGPNMQKTGYTLTSVLVRDVMPPEAVLNAMNDINASERRMIAARNNGEAAKIQHVLEAEGDAIRKELQGKGMAGMRDAIMSGWTESISKMSKELKMSESEISAFVLNVLHLDTVGDIGRNTSTKTIFLNHSPNAMRDAIMQGNEKS